MDLIQALTDDIDQALDNLPEPSSQDTPRTKDAWERLYELLVGAKVAIAAKYPDFSAIFDDEDDNDRTLTHDNDPPADKDPEEEEEETPAQKKERREAKTRGLIIKRAQKIYGALGQEPVTAQDLAEFIAEPVQRVAEQAEDYALACLIRGYEGPDEENGESWRGVLRPWLRHAKRETTDFMSLSSKLDKKLDLMQRDLNLRHTESASRTDTYLVNLIHKLETIKCASEWNAHAGRGAGNFKNDFHTKLFQAQNRPFFQHLDAAEKRAKMDEMSADFTLFKKRREDLITARNRLLFAYKSFGTGVLIDPFFCAENLGQRRAHGFKSLLDIFITLAPPSEEEDADGRNRFDELERKNRDVLYELADTLCARAAGEDAEEEQTQLADFLDQFFVRYPSLVRP
ncbi:hypothetical protein C8R47DRAFT_1327138 [Mycena vitilis]|nr:hypothetical protein C8R47DRAFT_1327138 [Mycena vitilis]